MGLAALLGMGMCRDVGEIKGEKDGVVRGRDTEEKRTGVLWLIQLRGQEGSSDPRVAELLQLPGALCQPRLWITEVVLYLWSEHFTSFYYYYFFPLYLAFVFLLFSW